MRVKEKSCCFVVEEKGNGSWKQEQKYMKGTIESRNANGYNYLGKKWQWGKSNIVLPFPTSFRNMSMWKDKKR